MLWQQPVFLRALTQQISHTCIQITAIEFTCETRSCDVHKLGSTRKMLLWTEFI
uniref:Uncharacterized protein n=1 Tax=Anguilla anguilla TaxID=7936 RepID=A0A0E9WW96_ANGAN